MLANPGAILFATASEVEAAANVLFAPASFLKEGVDFLAQHFEEMNDPIGFSYCDNLGGFLDQGSNAAKAAEVETSLRKGLARFILKFGEWPAVALRISKGLAVADIVPSLGSERAIFIRKYFEDLADGVAKCKWTHPSRDTFRGVRVSEMQQYFEEAFAGKAGHYIWWLVREQSPEETFQSRLERSLQFLKLLRMAHWNAHSTVFNEWLASKIAIVREERKGLDSPRFFGFFGAEFFRLYIQSIECDEHVLFRIKREAEAIYTIVTQAKVLNIKLAEVFENEVKNSSGLKSSELAARIGTKIARQSSRRI